MSTVKYDTLTSPKVCLNTGVVFSSGFSFLFFGGLCNSTLHKALFFNDKNISVENDSREQIEGEKRLIKLSYLLNVLNN